MKVKKLLVFLLISFFFSTMSAQLLNGGFEKLDSTNTYPAHWEVKDNMAGGMTEDSRSGKYAMKIWTWYNYIKAECYPVHNKGTNESSESSKGTPIDYLPKKLKGHYKLTDCDSSYVEVTVWGKEESKEPLAKGISLLPATDAYRPFEVVLQKTEVNLPPDRLVVLFSSYGRCPQGVQECCYLYIDALKLRKRIR